MSTEIVKFHYGPSDLDVRTTTRGDDVWFVAADVAKGLGFSDATHAIRYLDPDERSTLLIKEGPQQNHELRIISEPGLYKLIARSRKPAAKAFDRWVRHEVLPTIRKTGSYGLTVGIDEEALLIRVGGVVKSILYKALEERIPQEIERRLALMEAQFLAGHRHVATDRVSALDCVVHWGGTEPKGRRGLVLKIGHALRRLCNGSGIPIIPCDRTGVDLFPHEIAHEYMRRDGAEIVRAFMESRSSQGVLQFPDRRLTGAHRTGKRA